MDRRENFEGDVDAVTEDEHFGSETTTLDATPVPPVEVLPDLPLPEGLGAEIEDYGDFQWAHRAGQSDIPRAATTTGVDAESGVVYGEDEFNVKYQKAQWFNPEIRQAIYGVSLGLLPILAVYGIASEELWAMVLAVVDGCIGLLMAVVHTNTSKGLE